MKNITWLALAIAFSISARADDWTAGKVKVYVTAQKTGQRLSETADLSFVNMPDPTEKQQTVFVDPDKTGQTVLGIGGALTDASAETFYKLPEARQQEILRAYYDPQKGIGYTLGRTSIHSCDFSSESYTYVTNDDMSLASFDISHDLKYRIPFIKEVLAAVGKDNFTLYASPWSPPGWMKDNDRMLRGGKLKPEYYATWANYFVKFIEAYEKEGVTIWGVTVQNEPWTIQKWESCLYTPEEERDFVKSNLGPAFAAAGLSNKKIIVWDHNRSFMYERAKVILDDPEAAKYVWGLAFHWYGGDHFDNVRLVHEAYPNIHLMLSEACNYPFDMAKINDWNWGENYGESMINDFNNGAEGWTDWNVLLDENGGPNHTHNWCYAPIHANTKTGKLYYMNSYYYIGHFSKFIRPGAKWILSSSTSDNLQTTAFLNKDKSIAVIVMNASEKAQPFYLWLNGKAAKSNSSPHSIMTFVVSGS